MMIAKICSIHHIQVQSINFVKNMRIFISTFVRLSAFILCMNFSVLAHAQSTTDSSEAETNSEAPKITTLPPAYEPQMLRLSEILGSLHYIRELCKANEGSKWRQAMQDMIKNEEPTDERKAQMIANFNHGFRGFQETYRECTNAAIEANNSFVS